MNRLANLSRPGAAVVASLFLALLGLGFTQSGHILDARAFASGSQPNFDDLSLYRVIVDHVRAGEPYEPVAVREQRIGHFPLKPFVVVRPPALAIMLSWLPNEQTRDLSLSALAGITMIAANRRLRTMLPAKGMLAPAAIALLLFSGIGAPLEGGLLSTVKQMSGLQGPALMVGLGLLHEAWAGLLIALSFVLRTQTRFAASVCLGLAAALIRELAIPYLAVMAVIALMERRRGEALAFAGALAVSLGALALHAHAVSGLVRPDDLKSPGWVRFSGWNFILAMSTVNLIAVVAGKAASVVLVPLSLLGALRFKDPFGLRLAAILLSYFTGFMIVGRPENEYWGLLIIPLASIGLALSPWAMCDLGERLMTKSGASRPALTDTDRLTPVSLGPSDKASGREA
jgi:hypothetical protein